jgi:hypothetical protein
MGSEDLVTPGTSGRLSKLALVLLCLGAGPALAYKPVKDFQAPSQPSAEEIAESKARSKANVNDFNQDLAAEEEPVPWAEIILVCLVFVGVAPFAWRAYKNTAEEIGGRPTSARASRASDDA